jgi:hypothetical protein
MGKKKQPQVIYVQPPTPVQNPQQQAQDAAFNQTANSQLAAIQASYQKQLEGLTQQYQQNQAQSSGVIETLNQSLKAQQDAAVLTKQQALEAQKASESQLSLLNAQRDASAATLGDKLSAQTNQSNSLLRRLQRRTQARRVTY